jgi:hypothetical protein
MNTKKTNDDDLGVGDQLPEHPYTVPPELSKSFVQSFPPPYPSSTKRLSTDTAAAMSEVVRLFVVEAHARASVEVSRMEFHGI